MAFTTFLMIVSMVAITSAGFPRWPANDNPFPGFPSPVMPTSLRFGPIVSPPAVPPINFPLSFPPFNFPFFHTMPTFQPLPTDIASQTPTNGGSFSSVMVSTSTSTKRTENGTVVHDGGTTIVTNTDGTIKVEQTGNHPSKVPISDPPFDFNDPKMKPSNRNQFKNFNNYEKFGDFNNFGFRHTFPAIDIKKIETYVPGEGETYKGQSVRTHSFSTNNNGEVNTGGSAIRIDNDNGHVNKEEIVYNGDGTQS